MRTLYGVCYEAGFVTHCLSLLCIHLIDEYKRVKIEGLIFNSLHKVNSLGKSTGSGTYLFCGQTALSSPWNQERSVHELPPLTLCAMGSMRDLTEHTVLKRQSCDAVEAKQPAQKSHTAAKVWVHVASHAQRSETYFSCCLPRAQMSF